MTTAAAPLRLVHGGVGLFEEAFRRRERRRRIADADADARSHHERARRDIEWELERFTEPVDLSPSEIALAQALADVASIAIIQDQAVREAALREGHLQHALNSRVAIEQAKGMISDRSQVGMDEAFGLLRSSARNHNTGLTSAAEALVAGTLGIDEVAGRSRPPSPPRRS